MTLKNNKKIILAVSAFFIFSFFSSAKADTLGENRKFFVEPSYDASGRSVVNAYLIKITDRAYFYADQAWWNFTNQSEAMETINSLAAEFSNKIYPDLTGFYGSEWNPGIDNDPKVTILIHPMVKDAGGYFSEKDEYSIFENSSSNQREMIYSNSDYIRTSYINSLIAHDFVHLIIFNQKNRLRNIREDVWLNEARADYAPTILGYDDIYDGSNLQKRVQNFVEKPSDFFISDWKNTKYNYAAVNIFTQYLVDNYGKKILLDSLNTDKIGISSINSALSKEGYKDDFSQIFLNWNIAVYLNDCNLGDKYCYKNPALKDLHVVPQTNFLPMSGESTLTFADNLKNWSANWYKIIGGKDNLVVKFEGDSSAFSKIPYITRNRNGVYSVGYLFVGSNNKSEISIKNFGSDIVSFTIIPAIYKQNLPLNVFYSFFWSASNSDNSNNGNGDSELIKNILAQIEYLKNQIAKLQGQNANNGQTQTCNSFTYNLYMGMKNSQVSCLQEFLKSQGKDIYPEGIISGFFGQLTKNAVIKFQEKYGSEILSPSGFSKGTGIVGNFTRAKINALLAK